MAKMSNSEYESAKKFIQDTFQYGSGTKEAYERYIRDLIYRYDDGEECARRLDHYQTKWSVL